MAPSAEFRTEMDRKIGSMPIDKVEIVLDSGTIDLSAYYIGGAEFDQEKGGEAVKLNSGDAVLEFSNYNNYFSKNQAASLFYGIYYHNRNIVYSLGFRLPDNTVEYLAQFTAKIQKVEVSQDESRAYITVRDLTSKILNERINIYPPGLIPKGAGFDVTYPSAYPPAQSDTYVKATTTLAGTEYYPYFATDPAKSLIGVSQETSWSSADSQNTNQRFHIDLGSAKIIKRIYYENYHHNGLASLGGVKNFTLWGSNTAAAFAELTYGTDTNWTQITTAQSIFDQHVAADQADPKYILISNNTAYRYYAFKFADNRGTSGWMGVRQVELQEILYTPKTIVGNGTVTDVATKPFSTVNEDITATLSSASAFSVSGSVSGALGNGTVGSLFTASGNQVRFMITAGTAAFENGDTFTFTTYKYPEFTAVNPVKIIWALLTGFDYNTNVAEAWYERSLKMDNTQSAANTDIDYASFVAAIANIPFDLTGYIDYNMGANTVIEEILTLCMGSLFIDGDGKIEINVYAPSLGETLREFADTKKITRFSSIDDIDNMINSYSGSYKALDANWPWSNVEFTYDGKLSQVNNDSIIDNKIKQSFNFNTKWFSAGAGHLTYLFSHILDKKGTVPLEVYFTTGLDALEINISDRIEVSESKSGISNLIFEVTQIAKSFADKPKKISIHATNEGLATNWAFLGSSANEGDGLGWEVAASQSYDTANAAQKAFAYLSTTGAVVNPRYYIW